MDPDPDPAPFFIDLISHNLPTGTRCVLLGNKCAVQHNLKTVHFKETLASSNF
jgi:hypothetical protein